MKNHMTSRDYELISTYLDNQLGLKERAFFEARLKTDPELRKELQEISKTRLLVRRLPELRAPRNYFVKAETTRARPTLRLAPVFGIVSAVASVLLALVIFGSTFFSSSPQVAMAPAAQNPNAPLAAQQEVQRSVASPVITTEATPSVLMSAPILATPTPSLGTIETSQTEIATPTTIYLYAYPPTSTPEAGISINDQQTEVTRIPCEGYYGSSAYPTASPLYNCPTPTSTLSTYLESILTTSTPTPSETPTPTPAEIPPSVEKQVPPAGEVSSTEVTAPNQLLGGGNPVSTDEEQTETPASPNVSFLNYIVLTFEISLAAIAIIAGIIAIILRVRAR
jgi:hypothetical protein